MIKIKHVAAITLMFAAQPAFADKFFAVTPSGATEMVFPDRPTVVIGQISSKCIDSKWTVVSSTQTELVCEAPMSFGQSLMGQLLIGNSYSTPPRRFFRFNVAEINGISRVQASGWMELQMAFGQMKRTDFSGPEFHNSVMNFLSAAGGKFPVGTTFPNHVSMGFKAQDIRVGKNIGLKVTETDPESPATAAGVRGGDVITSIAGKKYKDTASYLDATAKAAESSTYPVELTRDDKTITVKFARAFRATWSEAVIARVDTPASPVATAAPTSIADELTKLSKLKEQGVLTQAEFDAQKQKLLDQ